jgi:uroporphyrinogen III methyltransferase / synthase
MAEPTGCCGWRGGALSGTDIAGALAGKRIVVTRAAEQAGELVHRLSESGARVLSVPMVRFLEPEDPSDLDRALADLGRFDWLIFTSANAVRFFTDRCRIRGCGPLPSDLRIAAVGPATLRALEAEGLDVSLMPRQSSGAALAAEFAGSSSGKRLLVPQSDRAADELPSALRRAGAMVTAVVAYRTAGPETLDAAALAALREGEADAVTFFSPSAFHQFMRVLGDEAVCRMCAHTAFAAVGPTTAAAIREAGVPVAVEAEEATAASLVAGLARYFAERGARKARLG